MEKQEVRYMDVPRRVGKSQTASALTRFNVGVLVPYQSQAKVLYDLGADEYMVFTSVDNMRGCSFSAIIIEEGFYRSSLNQDIKDLKAFDCPILVLGTSQFSDNLFIDHMNKLSKGTF